MTATNQSFSVLEGDHKEIIFEVNGFNTDDIAEIYWYCDDIEKTKNDMVITTNEIKFDLESKDTVDRGGGLVTHELKIVDSQGDVSTIAQGKMTIKKPEQVLKY